MTTTLNEFRAKFRLDELTVLSTEYWTWSVHHLHPTLGSGLLSLNRLCPNFGDLTPAEGRDFAVVVGVLERATRSAFQADRFNYLSYMMNDIHVHLHVLARYAEPRQFAGRVWTDDAWPAPSAFGQPSGITDGVLGTIRQHLLEFTAAREERVDDH